MVIDISKYLEKKITSCNNSVVILWQVLKEYWHVIINYSFFMWHGLLIRQMYSMFCHDSIIQSTFTVPQTHCVLSAHPQPRFWQPLILLLGSMSVRFHNYVHASGVFSDWLCSHCNMHWSCIHTFQVLWIHFSYGQMMFYCLNIPIYFPVYFW